MRTVLSSKRWLALAAAVSSVLGGVPTLRASDYGGANPNVDNNWNNPNNWSSPNAVPTSTDDVQLFGPPPASGRFIVLPNGAVANSLSFFDYYSLSGGTLALTTGSISVDGGVSLGAGGFNYIPGPLGSNSAAIDSNLINPAGGPIGLTKTGAGTLFLNLPSPTNSANTFGGAITISGGRLSVITDRALGLAANTVSLDGGTLGLNDTLISSRSINVTAQGGTLDVTLNPNVPNRVALFNGTLSAANATSTLTKAGLGILVIGSAQNYTGPIVMATNGGQIQLRGAAGTTTTPSLGSLTGAASFTINPYSTLLVDNRNTVGPYTDTQTIAAYSSTDRFADNIPITLKGGNLTFAAADIANTIDETFGTINLAQSRSVLTATSAGGTGNGANFNITNLNRSIGAAVSFNGSGTIGAAGQNGRYFITNIDSTAVAVTSNLGGWATANSFDFAGYAAPANVGLSTASGGVTVASYVAGVAAGAPGNNTGFATGTNTRLDAGSGATTFTLVAGNATTGAVKFNGAQTINLNFTNAADILNIESGGIISSDNNNTRTVGASAGSGNLTAGGGASSGTKELFLYVNQGTTTINSHIIDNPNGAKVALVKNYGGTVALATTNTYTGGTFVNGTTGGTLQANVVGSLGTGPVFVTQNGTMNLNAAVTTTGFTSQVPANATDYTYNAINGGGVQVNNFNVLATNQTIHIGAGSLLIMSGATGAGALTPGTNLFLDDGAIVVQSTATGSANNTLGAGLGTDPKYFFGISATLTDNVTVGTGSPWIGISTDRGSRIFSGGTTGSSNNTITANSDFVLQGYLNNGGYTTLTLGNGTGAGNVVQILAGTRVKATVIGNVSLNNDQSVYQNVTFVATPGATLSLAQANAMGGGASTTPGSIVMQQGSVLDIGGLTTNAMNGSVTFEAGSTLRLDDNPLTGVFNGTGTLTFKPGSALQFQQSGNINPVFALQGTQLFPTANSTLPAGMILRFNSNTQSTANGINAYGIQGIAGVNNADSTLVTGGTRLAPDTVIEMANGGTNTLTRATGDPTLDNVFLNGNVITATYNGGTLNQSGGRLIVGPNGATFAGGTTVLPTGGPINSTTTALTVAEDFDIPVSGRTLTIGSTATIDGLPKSGGIVFISGQGSRSVAGGLINITANTEAIVNGFYVLPDMAKVNIDAGAALLLNSSGAVETIGGLTGSGVVASNQGTAPTLQIGYGDQSSQFDGIFTAPSSTLAPFASQNLNVTKIGSGTLTLTGAHTTTGTFNQAGGTTVLAGASGSILSGTTNLIRGTLTLNDSSNAVSNRLGNGKTLNFGGGNLTIVGNSSTAVTETVGTLGVSSGGTSVIDFTTPGAGVTLNSTAMAGKSITTILLRGNFGTSTTKFTVNASGATGTFAAGQITTAVRADILHDNGTAGTDLAFTTYDPTNGYRRLTAAEYTPLVFTGQNSTGTGQPSSANLRLTTLTAQVYPLSAVPGQQPALTTNTNPGSTNTNQVQSLTLAGTGGLTVPTTPSSIGGLGLINVASGGVLVESGGNASVSSPFITFGGTADITTVGDLSLSGIWVNGNSIVKAGSGTLTLGTAALNFADGGNFSLNGGTVKLGANSDTYTNPLFKSALFINGTGGAGLRNMWLNSGTLDLNGNSLIVSQFSSSNVGLSPTQMTGGNIVNTGGTADLTVNGSQPFAGTISGIRNLNKIGNNTQNLYNTVAMTGDLNVRGGTLGLFNGGKITGMQSVNLMVGTLSLNNIDSLNYNQANDSSGAIVVADRIPSNVPITLRGSNLQFRSSAGIIDSQTFGNTGNATTGVKVLGGANQLDVSVSGNSSSNVTVGNLIRDPSSQAFLNFAGSNLGNSGEGYQVGHIVITKLNGVDFDSAPTLSNGLIGPWAIVNGSNFATYRTSSTVPTVAQPFGYGVSNMGNTNGTAANNNGFTAYSALAINANASGAATTTAADNINSTGGTEAAGILTRTINTLRSANNTTASTFTFNAGEVVTFASGGLITDTNAAVAINGGSLTAGSGTAPADFYVWINQNTTTISSAFVDNGGATGAVTLIKGGPATLTLTGVNTHSGGSIFSQATTNLSTANANGGATTATGSGNVTLNGSAVTATVVNATTSGQIANTAVVTFNGGNTTLNLLSAATATGTSTLGGLVFNNVGGGGNAPTLNISILNTNLGGGTLVLNGNITVTNDNLINVPTITQSVGGTAATTPVAVLDLGGSTRTITTNGLSFLGLNIQAAITNGGIIKEGTGTLGIGNASANLNPNVAGNPGTSSTLTGGIVINNGVVRADSQGALGASGAGGNTTTVNAGGILAFTQNNNNTGNIVLNGGTIQGIANVTPLLTGNVSVTDNSTIAQQDYFYAGQFNRNITFNGPVTVSAGKTLSVTAAPYSGSVATITFTNGANDFTAGNATLAIGPNAQVTANTGATPLSVGTAVNGANIVMTGGRFDMITSGLASQVANSTIAVNNPLSISGAAQLNIDRGSSTTATANTIQFGALTLGTAGSDVILTTTAGNSYTYSFGGGVAGAGVAMANGRSIGLNAVSGTVNLNTVSGAPASFTKYGNAQANVATWDSTFSNSGADVTIAGGVLQSNATSGTAFTGGTLTTRWGTLTGTVSGTGVTGTLRNTAGTGNTVTFAPATIVHEGLIQANTGTMSFAGKFIGNGAAAPGSSPFSSSFSEKFFNGGVTDANITLSNATSYFAGVTPSATGTLTTQRLSFESRQVQARARDNSSANGTGALWMGSFTVGGGAGQIPAGPVSFGLASDDGSTLYVDYNHNNTFEANEMVIDNRLGHGVQALVNTTPALTAGSYNFAVAFYNSGPATNFGAVELRYYPGAMGAGVTPNTNNPATGGGPEPVNGFQPIPFANQYIVAPGGQTMGGILQVDSGATLTTGGFNVDTITIASGGTLSVDSTAPASIVGTIFMNSTSGTGTLDIASGKTVTVTNAVGVGQANATTLAKTGAGSLLVNGAGSSTFTGSLAVHAGTLGGFGSIAGPLVTVNSDANLAPGNGGNTAGILTIANTASTAATVLTMTNNVNGTATLGANSNFLVDIVSSGTTAGTDYDQLKIVATNATPAAGNISLGGLANLIISMTGTVPSGNGYVIIDNTTSGSTTGTFAGLNEGDTVTVGAQQFTITYAGTAPGESITSPGNDVILTATVPEPASFGLLGLGAIGLLSRRRRRRV